MHHRLFRTFSSRYARLRTEALNLDSNTFTPVRTSDLIRFVRISNDADVAVVQISLTVSKKFEVQLKVNNRPLTINRLPTIINTVDDISLILGAVEELNICPGNFEKHFQNLAPYGVPMEKKGKETCYTAYKEYDFGLEYNGIRFKSSVRSVDCSLLISNGERICGNCKKARTVLNRKLRVQQENTRPEEYTLSTKPNHLMTDNEKREKLKFLAKERKALKERNEILEKRVEKLKNDINRLIRGEGVDVEDDISKDFIDILKDHKHKSFSDTKSMSEYQQLFIEQQLKAAADKGMRWHPTMLKLCIYLHSKSPKAYKTLRDSGFVKLPCTRTLYDYTHCFQGED